MGVMSCGNRILLVVVSEWSEAVTFTYNYFVIICMLYVCIFTLLVNKTVVP